jgi:hypothetical protein
VVPVGVVVPVWLPPLGSEVGVEGWPGGVDVVGVDVVEPGAEPPAVLVCAVWAGYGSTAAPPLDIEVVPGAEVDAVEEGSTVGSDCVWVRPAGTFVASAGVVAFGVAAVTGVFVFVRALAALTAFVVCDVVCEAFECCATRLATGGARVDELVSPAGGAAGAYVTGGTAAWVAATGSDA